MELQSKVALVTGGANGIGQTLVEALVKRGATVAVFDVDAAGLQRLAQNSETVYPLCCDVTDIRQVKDGINQIYQDLGNINILINNAGLIFSAPLVSVGPEGIRQHSLDMWHKVISLNLTAVFSVTVNVVEEMIKRRSKGVIVNISSISAAGNAGQSAYSAAKAGVNALTMTWAKELGPLGIRVVGLAPGFTDTRSTRMALSDRILDEIRRETPLRRLGQVEEIAAGIIALIENDFFNGKIFELDGGLVV